MKMVALCNTGKTTSALGFGCAGLMRPSTANEREALVKAAFDSGIRHFDTARYYGHGASESVLGKFLAENRLRDQVTVTTKFGIQPTSLGKSSVGKSIMAAARRVATLHPAVRRAMAGYASRSVRTNCFDPGIARSSLETSLRELRTDHVDLFLLHDADLDDARTPGLLEFMEEAKQSGKVRAYGCATGLSQTQAIIADAPEFGRVVQIANGFGHPSLERLPDDPERFVLTHGALKALSDLEAAFSQATISPVRDEDRTYLPLRGTKLAGFILGFCLSKNPNGITLFSSTHPNRIRENAEQAMSCKMLTDDDWSNFKRTAESALLIPKAR